MTLHHSIKPQPPKPRLACAICGAPTDVLILRRPICADCCERAEDADVRIYRKSFRVIQGGLPS